MQATFGFLQHYAPDTLSLRALIATLVAEARAQLHTVVATLRGAGGEVDALDAHMRRDIGLGEFGTDDVAALRGDLVRG